MGLLRQTEISHAILPNPANGGSRGYPVWHRIQDLFRAERNLPTDASVSSHWRWGKRLLPFRMTGNRSSSTITGADQLLAAICITIWPDYTTDDIATFIHNEVGGVHTRSQISRRMRMMQIINTPANIIINATTMRIHVRRMMMPLIMTSS